MIKSSSKHYLLKFSLAQILFYLKKYKCYIKINYLTKEKKIT